jgi:hypothetical protein
MFGFARGAKMRTSIRQHDLAYGQTAPNMPPGYAPASLSYGIVYGESSISAGSGRPQVVSGIEHKFNIDFNGNPNDKALIRSLFVSSGKADLEMQYLHHEGQETVLEFPKVYFDGSYITVDALTTDITEDTYIWYVIRNVGGSGVDVSFQIFITDVEVNWQGESTVSSIFNSTSVERLNVISKYDEYYQKVQEWIDLLRATPIDGTAVSAKSGEIGVLLGEVSTAIDQWTSTSTVEDGLGNQVNVFDYFSSIVDDFISSVSSEYSSLVMNFENYSCAWKDSVGIGNGFLCGQTNSNISSWAHSQTAYDGNMVDSTYQHQIGFKMMMNNQVAFGTQDSFNTAKDLDQFYIDKTRELFLDEMVKLDIKYKTALKLRGLVDDLGDPTLPTNFNVGDYIANI